MSRHLLIATTLGFLLIQTANFSLADEPLMIHWEAKMLPLVISKRPNTGGGSIVICEVPVLDARQRAALVKEQEANAERKRAEEARRKAADAEQKRKDAERKKKLLEEKLKLDKAAEEKRLQVKIEKSEQERQKLTDQRNRVEEERHKAEAERRLMEWRLLMAEIDVSVQKAETKLLLQNKQVLILEQMVNRETAALHEKKKQVEISELQAYRHSKVDSAILFEEKAEASRRQRDAQQLEVNFVKDRLNEAQDELSRLKSRKLIIRNWSHGKMESNLFTWGIHLVAHDTLANEIDWVEYIIHPTFRRILNRVTDDQRGYEFVANGWGEFRIGVRVVLKSGEVIAAVHDLELN